MKYQYPPDWWAELSLDKPGIYIRPYFVPRIIEIYQSFILFTNVADACAVGITIISLIFTCLGAEAAK